MTLIQLNLPLPLETSKAAGWTHFPIDYEPGDPHCFGVVFMDVHGLAGRDQIQRCA
jgi:hypothetical protein